MFDIADIIDPSTDWSIFILEAIVLDKRTNRKSNMDMNIQF